MQVDPIYLLQLTLNGLMLGLIYALIACGLALVFGVLEIINFAHGEMLMVGAFVMSFSLEAFAGNYLPALLISLIVCAFFGLLLYRGFLIRLREKDFERSILITIGLSMVMLYGFQYIFSATPRSVNSQFGLEGVEIGGLRITWTRLAACALAVIGFVLLWVTLFKTQWGRAMRAVANNRDAALMVGIQPQVVARNAVVLSSLLAGLAGAALAPVYLVQPIMGQYLIFKAFALVIIGGLGSVGGAVIAGIALGIIESWIGGFYDMIWQESTAFLLMILVLLIKPHGILGRPKVRLG